jgi:ABC-type branched-subunit amino acid transport system permease subunit
VAGIYSGNIRISFFGLFLGLAAARLSGPYLAGTTLVMALAIPSIAIRFESFFSGDIGFSVDYGYPPDWLTNLLGEISIEEWSLYVALPFAALSLFAVLNLSNTRSGRTWRAVRDNEVAAALAGINIARTKVIVFVCISASWSSRSHLWFPRIGCTECLSNRSFALAFNGGSNRWASLNWWRNFWNFRNCFSSRCN